MTTSRRRSPVAFLLVALAVSLPGQDQEFRSPAAPRRQLATRIIEGVSLPRGTSSFGSCRLGAHVYGVGGHAGRPHHYDRTTQSGTFYRFPVRGGELEVLPGNYPLQSVALVPFAGRLYRIGGLAATNEPGEEAALHSVGQFGVYDPKTREWAKLPSLPAPRSSHEAVVLGSEVYVFGGWTLGRGRPRWAETTLVFDLADAEGAWREIPQPFVRRAMGGAARDGKIYGFGGLNRPGKMVRDLYILDGRTETWREGVALPFNGFGSSGAVMDGRLFASGRGGAVWEFDRADEHWTRWPRLASGTFFHRLVAGDDDTLIALGGAARTGMSPLVEWLHVGRNTHRSVAIARSMPWPGGASVRNAVLVGHEVLFLGETAGSSFKIDLNTGNPAPLMATAGTVEGLATVGVTTAELLAFGLDGQRIRRLDPEEGAWVDDERELPAGLTGFGVASSAERVWLVGGRRRNVVLRDVLSFDDEDPDAGVARTKTPLPSPRANAGCALVNGVLHVVGGVDQESVPRAEVLRLDAESGTWTELAPLPGPVGSPRVAACGEHLFVLGRESEDRAVLRGYDAPTNTWRIVASVPARRPRLLSHGGCLVICETKPVSGHLRWWTVRP